jgi:tRNA(Ile)-lysidine synthase
MPESLVLLQQLIRVWPPDVWRDVTVVAAVSGGPDSVALLRGLAAVRLPGSGQLISAHFNHGLRGEQSEADEAFVVDLCRRLGISCVVGRADRAAGTLDEPEGDRGGPGGSQGEAQLRAARYQFLCDTARQAGARYVATGHTADDQAETVLLRILRGTGIAGLAGIRRHRQLTPGVSLVRPLLNVSRDQAREYVESLGQGYRDDRSNSDLRYTRNRVRHELLPHLADQYNPGVVDALTRLAGLAEGVQDVVASLLGDLQTRCVRVDSPDQVTVDCRELASVSRYLVRELLIAVWQQQGWPLQAMGYERWEQLADLACPAVPPSTDWKRVFPGSICVQRDGPWLRLLASPAEASKSIS